MADLNPLNVDARDCLGSIRVTVQPVNVWKIRVGFRLLGWAAWWLRARVVMEYPGREPIVLGEWTED